MSRKGQRAIVIGGLLGAAALAIALILTALNDNIVFFFSPSEVSAASFSPDKKFRLGGLVVNQSLQRDGSIVKFSVTDGAATLPVTYHGVLPDLFREGQGVVAEGRLAGTVFIAESVLAKHDENYMPREVADALKKQGHWRDNQNKANSP